METRRPPVLTQLSFSGKDTAMRRTDSSWSQSSVPSIILTASSPTGLEQESNQQSFRLVKGGREKEKAGEEDWKNLLEQEYSHQEQDIVPTEKESSPPLTAAAVQPEPEPILPFTLPVESPKGTSFFTTISKPLSSVLAIIPKSLSSISTSIPSLPGSLRISSIGFQEQFEEFRLNDPPVRSSAKPVRSVFNNTDFANQLEENEMKTELLPVIIPAVASNTVELGAQVFPSTDIVKAASPPPFLPPIIQDLPRKISFSISPPPTDSEPVKSLDHTLIIESLVGKVPPVEQPRTRKQTLLSRIGISNPGYKSEKSAGLESPKESFESPGKLKEKEKEKIKYLKTKVKGKPSREFKHLFLAQEIRLPSVHYVPPSPSPSMLSRKSFERFESVDSSHSNSRPDPFESIHLKSQPSFSSMQSNPNYDKKNTVFCMEFSKNGQFLAVGGKDGILRIYEVLSNAEDRAAMTSDLDSPPSFSSSTPATPTRKRFTSQPIRLDTPFMESNVAPVFKSRPVFEFRGHTADILDLSWSNGGFLISASMDKTCRLWFVSLLNPKPNCLSVFPHLDFVTNVDFHPLDDRFFLSSSLDRKLRLWSIPAQRVDVWIELPELISCCSFSADGKLAIAGNMIGNLLFLDVGQFGLHSSIVAKGKKKKIISIVPITSASGEKLLISSNDEIKLLNYANRATEVLYSSHTNTTSQIRATTDENHSKVISGSEDGSVYIWNSGLSPKQSNVDDSTGTEKSERNWFGKVKKVDNFVGGVESFEGSMGIVTCAIFAPKSKLQKLLSRSNDPVFPFLPPLQPMQSYLTATDLSSNQSRGSTETLEFPDSFPLPQSHHQENKNAIITVGDDVSNTIRIYRNSEIL